MIFKKIKNVILKTKEKDKKSEKKQIKLIDYYVKPHRKISIEVTEKDLLRVMKDAKILYNLCFTQHGIHPGAFAVSHPQINNKDPLRFFVIKDKEIIINPVIIRHTKYLIDSQEGCTSFPDKLPIIVQRYNKCEVQYQIIKGTGKKLIDKKESLSGLRAKIFQHEIDHLNAIYIFNID